MKKIYALLFALSVMTVSATATAKTTKHKIKSGETLYTIAHKNHTTIVEVQKVNGLKKGDKLKVGRVLTVPTNTYVAKKKSTKKIAHKVSKKKSTPKIVKHSIKSGETLYTIAHANHTTIEEVRKVNSLKKGETLKVGRVLRVPKNTYVSNKKLAKKSIHKTSKKKSTLKIVKHKIKSGETLFTIAKKHHTTIAEVRKVNGLKKGANLKIGRVLKVPKNTYNVPKTKLATKTIGKKKKVKVSETYKKIKSKTGGFYC